MKIKLKTAKAKVLVVACVSVLTMVAPAYAINPTTGYKWSSSSQILQNNGSTSFYTGIWNTASSNWTNSTNFKFSGLLSNPNYTAGDTYDSTVGWDGITYTTYTGSTINYESSYVNRYYTAQSKYTTAICNGIATHELGHSVGLAHTSVVVISVMGPYTFNSDGSVARTSNSPSSSDIQTVNYLYPQLVSTSNPLAGVVPTKVELDASWAVKYKDVQDLTSHADLVVDATVLSDKGTHFAAKDQYHTYRSDSEVKINKVLRGNESLKSEKITIKQMGGTNGETTVVGEGTTKLKSNDHVLLLLTKVGDNTYIPINEDESIYEIKGNGSVKHFLDQKEYSEKEITTQVQKK